jgi:hypothetical protein
MPQTDPAATPSQDAIVCRVTPWYYRRMGLISLMLLGFGLYFLYDGKWGYPAENEKAETKRQMETYDDAHKAGGETLKKWMEQAKLRGWVRDLETPPNWNEFAAQRGWASATPEMHSPAAIAQQFEFGAVLVAGALVCVTVLLLNRNKTLVSHEDRMIMPDGTTVRFTDVFKVDKRKWGNKALAYVYYREGTGQSEKRAVVDDLKFAGAGRVLDRLLAKFSGELIEKVPDGPDAPAQAPQKRGD